MNKTTILLLYLACLSNFLSVHQLYADAKVLTLQAEQPQYDLLPFLDYWEDPGSKLKFEDRAQMSAKQPLVAPPGSVLHLGFSTSSWWARVRISNPTNHPVDYYFFNTYANLDEISLKLFGNNNELLQSALLGDKKITVPMSSRFRLPHTKLSFPPGESELWLRVNSESPLIFTLRLATEEQFLHDSLRDYTFLIATFLILSVLAIAIGIAWIIWRQATFITFTLFIFTLMIQALAYSGLIQHVLADPSWFQNIFYLSIAFVSVLLGFLFTLQFLQLAKKAPLLYRICQLGIGFALAGFIMTFYSYSSAIKIVLILSSILSLVALAIGLWMSLLRSKEGYYYLIGWAMVAVFNSYRMAMLSGKASPSFLAEWGILIGAVFQSLVLTAGIIEYAWQERKNSLAAREFIERTAALEGRASKRLAALTAHNLNNPMHVLQLASDNLKLDAQGIEHLVQKLFSDVDGEDPETQAIRRRFAKDINSLYESSELMAKAIHRASEMVNEIRTIAELDGPVDGKVAWPALFSKLADRLHGSMRTAESERVFWTFAPESLAELSVNPFIVLHILEHYILETLSSSHGPLELIITHSVPEPEGAAAFWEFQLRGQIDLFYLQRQAMLARFTQLLQPCKATAELTLHSSTLCLALRASTSPTT